MKVSDYGMLTTVTYTVSVHISVSWGGQKSHSKWCC